MWLLDSNNIDYFYNCRKFYWMVVSLLWYFWRMDQVFLFLFCYDVGFFIFVFAKNEFGWLKLQTLSLSNSSNHNLFPLVLSWFPCQIYLSSAYTQKRGLSSLPVSLLGWPVPANLISSRCGCPTLHFGFWSQ